VRAQFQALVGFVEADVTVASEAEDQQIDPAGARECPFVAFALSLEISGGAIQHVRAPRVQIHVIEEMAAHEPAVAALIVSVQADEFVEVEGRDAREVDCARPPQRYQFAIQRNRRPAGRQSEHQPRIAGD